MILLRRSFNHWTSIFPRMITSSWSSVQTLWRPVELPTLGDMNKSLKTADDLLSEAILQLNRNARPPKLSNHGARPCSSFMRRLKKKGAYRRWKEKTQPDADDNNPRHGHILDESELPGR